MKHNQSQSSTPSNSRRRRPTLRAEYMEARRSVLRTRTDYNAAQRAFRAATREANALESRLFRAE